MKAFDDSKEQGKNKMADEKELTEKEITEEQAMYCLE